MLHKPAADGIDPIDVEIGLNLRRLRKARAMSQSDLAGKLGLTFQQVQKYERGANRISGSTLVRAARALGVQAADILPSTDATPLPTFAPLIASLRGAEEVMHGYAAIRSTKARYAVLSLIRVLADCSDEPDDQRTADAPPQFDRTLPS